MSTKKIIKEQPEITKFFFKGVDNNDNISISNISGNDLGTNEEEENFDCDPPNEQPEDEILSMSSQVHGKRKSPIKRDKLELDADTDEE